MEILKNTAGKYLPDLPASDVATLKGFAENGTGTAAQKAQNALCFHYGICYDNHGNPKSNSSPKPNKPYPNEKEVLSHFNNSNVFPSPASAYTTIDYNLLYANEKTILSVYDAIGRRVLTRTLGNTYQGLELIDTPDFINCNYIIVRSKLKKFNSKENIKLINSYF